MAQLKSEDERLASTQCSAVDLEVKTLRLLKTFDKDKKRLLLSAPASPAYRAVVAGLVAAGAFRKSGKPPKGARSEN